MGMVIHGIVPVPVAPSAVPTVIPGVIPSIPAIPPGRAIPPRRAVPPRVIPAVIPRVTPIIIVKPAHAATIGIIILGIVHVIHS